MMTHAMGEAPLRFACRSESDKIEVSEDLCALFADRVRAAVTRPTAAVAEFEDADLTLVVLRADAQTLSARIDTPSGPGEPRAAARRDAPLDNTTQARLIDSLLAQVDLP